MSPLTAGVVRAVAFSKPPISKRGCHEDQVDEFLDRIATTIAALDDRS